MKSDLIYISFSNLIFHLLFYIIFVFKNKICKITFLAQNFKNYDFFSLKIKEFDLKSADFDLKSVDFDLKSVDSDLKFYNLSKNIWFKSLENVKGSDLNGDE